MTKRYIPYATLVLVLSTVVVSLVVNFQISGSLFGKIKITELEPFGGFTYKHILDLELWRLVVSQLIHVKQFHMIYNAFSLLALGYVLERKLGSSVFLLIWFIAGSIGTFASTFTVPEPWNLGTGGSQAILGLAAAGIIMYLKRHIEGKLALTVLVLTIVPAFALDLIFSEHHLPKVGHVVSFGLGVLLLYSFQQQGKTCY
ncbi:rhomboid family intramembrane serine protease [Vibrio intestinalis]|uniref:rhomboid family intramembrane serine protease n=1 Tax=Vibrio intestinalis TaxID=2933291 RepID=UPI0021A7E387